MGRNGADYWCGVWEISLIATEHGRGVWRATAEGLCQLFWDVGGLHAVIWDTL